MIFKYRVCDTNRSARSPPGTPVPVLGSPGRLSLGPHPDPLNTKPLAPPAPAPNSCFLSPDLGSGDLITQPQVLQAHLCSIGGQNSPPV